MSQYPDGPTDIHINWSKLEDFHVFFLYGSTEKILEESCLDVGDEEETSPDFEQSNEFASNDINALSNIEFDATINASKCSLQPYKMYSCLYSALDRTRTKIGTI